IGIACVALDPPEGAPDSRVCRQIVAAYDDRDALAELAAASDVVTYEFENVPVESARFVAERVPVFPPPKALEISQDRVSEKRSFEEIGLPTARWTNVDEEAQLPDALRWTGGPSVLKTRRLGYDGKGQAPVGTAADVAAAWRWVGGAPSILEKLVPFERELSIIGVRGRDGGAVFYPLIENRHRRGILRTSVAPAPEVPGRLQAEAERHALAAMEFLDHVGVLTIELFQVGEQLLGNEIAPRVHNSGHWTIEGAATSQFENHLRAICGMELGPTTPSAYSAMVNLIGRMPPPGSFPAGPGVHVHDYGKHARPGRKLGHVTVVGEDRDTVFRVLQVITRTADT
ncbi:MAG TPA: 5-(carboxyamino)imidazole ribonucleotide synthase, partial [Actinomycetota bacterium]|nr:5-(carboxyamino)imidazole ribonucleotide synthase [Actinomycetota bacterium]